MHVLLAMLAIATPVDSLRLGASEKEVTDSLRGSGASIEWVDAGR